METSQRSLFINENFEFLSYLWGMETCYNVILFLELIWFLSYLWGMETNSSLFSSIKDIRSYPTYEEWKQCSNGVRWPFLIVLILPMRNGNLRSRIEIEGAKKFLSYLWGMETTRFRVYKRQVYAFLSYLWGMETPHLKLRWTLRYTFLSYLWGMETWYVHTSSPPF